MESRRYKGDPAHLPQGEAQLGESLLRFHPDSTTTSAVLCELSPHSVRGLLLAPIVSARGASLGLPSSLD